MTLIETGILTFDGQGDLDDFVCTDRGHTAVDRVCVICKALHLPTMEAVAYCSCRKPVLEANGLAVWRCGACDLPNKDALLGRLPDDKGRGTISGQSRNG